ncbi:hypothetical protein [Nannocystis sp. SCPEA4]|uniref:hypothetical protein n=1 Tax=Nannocystis sp. SCPEA4 TaxID=2996787 RepID=UPI00226FD9E1|nr:hypothetical protein [Nannocystis sp. SCPEA4]MCY1055441.1 hypothetical protein [Nannocystis sp. SCPEA4]
MAIDTAWLIGSYHEGVAGMTATLAGSASTIVPDDQPGGVYLYHDTDALSLIDLLEDAMLSVPIAGAQVRVLENRKVRISATNTFTITWTNLLLRTLLGFTADLAGQNSYTAQNVSPLLWSPGKPESPTESPLGTLGRPVYDTRFSTGADGTQVSTSSHTQHVQTFSWPFVSVSRYQTADALGGEYLTFFDFVLRRANKFFLWRNIAEDLDGTDPVVWTSSPLGPYGFRPARSPISPDFRRSQGLERIDRRMNVQLDCLVVPEWRTP